LFFYKGKTMVFQVNKGKIRCFLKEKLRKIGVFLAFIRKNDVFQRKTPSFSLKILNVKNSIKCDLFFREFRFFRSKSRFFNVFFFRFFWFFLDFFRCFFLFFGFFAAFFFEFLHEFLDIIFEFL